MLRGGRPSAPKPPLPRGVQPGGTPAPRRLARGRAVVSRCGSPHRAPGLRGAMREACCGRRCLIGRAHDPETPGRCCAGQGPGCPYAQLHAPRSSWAAGSRCTPIIARLGGCGEDLPWPDSAACRPGTAGQRSPGEGHRPPTSAPSRARARARPLGDARTRPPGTRSPTHATAPSLWTDSPSLTPPPLGSTQMGPARRQGRGAWAASSRQRTAPRQSQGVLPAIPRRERPGAPQTRRGAQAGPERESARTCRGVNVGAAACVQLFYTVSPVMDPSP